MSEYIVELDSKRSIALGLAFAEEMRGGDFVREEIVRCKDCKHSRKDGTLCMFFASWEPISGGDEYAEMPAHVEPNGFCAWGERKAEQ